MGPALLVCGASDRSTAAGGRRARGERRTGGTLSGQGVGVCSRRSCSGVGDFFSGTPPRRSSVPAIAQHRRSRAPRSNTLMAVAAGDLVVLHILRPRSVRLRAPGNRQCDREAPSRRLRVHPAPGGRRSFSSRLLRISRGEHARSLVASVRREKLSRRSHTKRWGRFSRDFMGETFRIFGADR